MSEEYNKGFQDGLKQALDLAVTHSDIPVTAIKTALDLTYEALEKPKVKSAPCLNQILVGRGIFTWNKSEWVSDRYGSCWLMEDGGTSVSATHKAAEMRFPPEGQKGRLIAKVIEPRESTHIGDFFRGLVPKTPKAGDVFILGVGKSFTETENWAASIGVEPEVERHNDWMDPKAVYNIHESLVELVWETMP